MRRNRLKEQTLLSHSSPRFPIASPDLIPETLGRATLRGQFVRTSLALSVMACFSPAFAQSNSPEVSEKASSEPKIVKAVTSENSAPTQTAPAPSSEKKPPADSRTTVIQALQITGQPDVVAHLDTQVSVVRGDLSVEADKAHYLIEPDQIDADGHVVLKRKGDCYRGEFLQFFMGTGRGYVEKPSYFLEKNKAQGKAEKIDFTDEEHATIRNGTYSTCEGLAPDWYLKTDTLDLDTGLDLGYAKGSVLYFKGVPIMGTPKWINFSFPLSGARQSGLLPPTFGHSNKGGVEFGLPYYFNLAPNRDLTVHPKLIAQRGLQLGLEGRYLGEDYQGETSVEAIRDKLTDTTRYAASSIHSQKLTPQVVFSWNLNRASDDNYPADFSNSTAKTAQRLLLREVGLDYYGAFWSASMRSTSYQVLQDVLAPITRPYERLPQISLHAGKNDVMGLDWSLDAMLTRFWHPTLIRGQRAVLNPQLALPLIRPGFFVIPKISYHLTSYQLDNPLVGQDSHLHRALPSVSLDTGLVFERPINLFDTSMTQTLEPRLFYVKTPFRDQKNFPLFDTALADFNFAQIFSENRFTGHDRIGDSNQVTAGVVSRFIEDSGRERFQLALGQRFYFNSQKVSLDNGVTPSRSDLLLAGLGQISDSFNVEAALQVSQTDHQSVRSSYGIHWQPETKKILNLQYQFQRDVLKQLEISGQWPMAKRWYVVGKSNYSLLNNKLVEGLAGLEYRADCWALRFVAHRFATTNLNNNSGFAVQLELNGLARLGFGANPVETMKKSIQGYRSGE